MSMVHCRGCGKEIHESAVTCPGCGAPQPQAAPSAARPLKSQTAAALFAMFLGGIGGHKFYLGQIAWGIAYLLLCWTGIPGLVAVIEVLLIAFMPPSKWAAKHNNGQLSAPVGIFVKVIALIIPALFVLGILAAIAIPQYQEYKARATAASVLVALSAPKIALSEHLAAKGGAPLQQSDLDELRKLVADNRSIMSLDAFAYQGYGDIAVKASIGDHEGSLYLVSKDAGKSWGCVGAGFKAAHLPKSCDAGDAPQRPIIPKAIPMVGLWEKPFYDSVLTSCVSAATSRGDPNGETVCACMVGKLAPSTSQKDIQGSTPEANAAIQEARQQCRPAS